MDSLYSSSQHQVINKIPISPSSEKDDSSSEAFTMFDATYSDPLYSNSSTIASNPRVLVSPECKKTIRRVVTLSGTLYDPLLLTKQQQQQLQLQLQLSEQQNQYIPPSSQDFDYGTPNNRNTIRLKPKVSKERGHMRLNKFVRRLHDMLLREKDSGIVEWRRGLLVLFSTDAFSNKILPKYFNTRNFKTFRRQLNYYGFVHVRSFSATGNTTTTALWINQNLAENEVNDDISAVLKLRRVEPDEMAKTVEGRRLRKELAIHTVEEDIGLNPKTLQLDQIRSMAIRGEGDAALSNSQGTIKGTRPSREVIHIPTDSDNSLTISVSSTHTNYSSNDDESTGSDIQSAARDEISNTDEAASVLLMLSRS